ncbi:MAG: hypothetical protein GXP35_08720 [Actinobacteria bacterium]|nr:hypothetical protein [Actinomycetota bacterium]
MLMPHIGCTRAPYTDDTRPETGIAKSSLVGVPTGWQAWMYDSCSAIELLSIVDADEINPGRGTSTDVVNHHAPCSDTTPPLTATL